MNATAMNADIATILFTDIEGSTHLWEQDSERMRLALAHHDDVLRVAVESNRGTIVKTSNPIVEPS
jgi:class 3 adenylate cyclase